LGSVVGAHEQPFTLLAKNHDSVPVAGSCCGEHPAPTHWANTYWGDTFRLTGGVHVLAGGRFRMRVVIV
jgi:hypothetical protein